MNKKLWFKAKTYGWGWTPCSWEGWAVTCAYIAIIVLCALTLDASSDTWEIFVMGVLPFVLSTVAFIRIAYKRGEAPEWRWGNK